MLEPRQRQPRQNLSQDEDVLNPIIQAGVGGLNTTDGALNMPLVDSFTARNVVVGGDGILRRRPGTYNLGLCATRGGGATTRTKTNHAAVTTPNGHDFIMARYGSILAAWNLFESQFRGAYRVRPNIASQVLPSRVAFSDGSMTVLRDPRIRVITTTSECPPIETRINELRTTGDGTNSVTVERADLEQLVDGVYLPQNIIPQQMALFRNGATTTPIDTTITPTTITFTFSSILGTSDLLDIVLFQSYWWGEAQMYYGDRFCDSVIRTNLDENDLHVAVPSNLRDTIDQRGTSPTSPHTIDALYWDGANYSRYTQVGNGLPVGPTQFAMSDGTARINNSPVVPSPLFLTYGEAEPGTVQPVLLHRHRPLEFRGGRGVSGTDLEVYIGPTRMPWTNASNGTTFVGPAYRLWDQNDTTQITSINTLGQYISLDGQWLTKPEINPSSVVRLVVTRNEFTPTNMSRVPVYGFDTICDYGAGSFPSCSTTYQDRLVVGGMPHDPLLVAFSAVYDSRTPSEPYMYFQNDPLDLDPDSAPFQVRIESSADDRIIALEEFQGSLFVLTYRGVFRIAAPGRTVITSTNYFVSSVSNIGAVGSNAVARPEGGIAFLSPRGLFAVVNGVQSNESTEYKLVELSQSISSLFDSSLSDLGPSRLWWVSYSSEERRIYMGTSISKDVVHASKLHTYDIGTQTWAEMDTPGGFRTYEGFDVQLKRDKAFHYMICDIYLDGAYWLVGTGRRHHLDFQRNFQAGTLGSITTPKVPPTQVTPVAGRAPFEPSLFGQIYKVVSPMSPLTAVRDILVNLGGRNLEPFTEYEKLPGGYIQLKLDPRQLGDLTITHVNHANTLSPAPHSSLVSDGVLRPNQEWFRTLTPEEANGWEWSTQNVGQYDQIVGVVFQSVWASPVYTLGTITQNKSVESVTLYLETVRNLPHWYGTEVGYDSSYKPILEVRNGAGTQRELTDVPSQPWSADIGLLTDQSADLTHPHSLGLELDFADPTESESYPSQLQRGMGIALRRAFSDVVNVFQVVVVSRDAHPFGVGGLQVDATVKPANNLHYSH